MSKITKIEAQKRTKDRVNIYIDESYAFSVSTELVYREGLRKDLEINEEKLKKVVKEDNIIKCKNPSCITKVEEYVPHSFILVDEENGRYRCEYCDVITKLSEN